MTRSTGIPDQKQNTCATSHPCKCRDPADVDTTLRGGRRGWEAAGEIKHGEIDRGCICEVSSKSVRLLTADQWVDHPQERERRRWRCPGVGVCGDDRRMAAHI